MLYCQPGSAVYLNQWSLFKEICAWSETRSKGAISGTFFRVGNKAWEQNKSVTSNKLDIIESYNTWHAYNTKNHTFVLQG